MVKHAIKMTEKHVHVRSFTLVEFEVKFAHAAGNKLWIPPAKKP